MEQQRGESMTLMSRDFTVTCIRPCGTEEGKVMGEARLSFPVSHERLAGRLKERFGTVSRSPEIRASRFDWKGKSITVFDSGKICIRNAEDRHDVLSTVKLLSDILKS